MGQGVYHSHIAGRHSILVHRQIDEKNLFIYFYCSVRNKFSAGKKLTLVINDDLIRDAG